MLFKIKLYKNYIYCLFIAFLKYSRCLSIIILVHWCCCSELIVHMNAGKTVKCLLSDVWYFTFFQSIFSWGEITCVWVLNLCLNYRFLQLSTRSRTCILYNKVWKDNWTYLDTCQYYILYCSIVTIWVVTSIEIIISLIRS